MIGRTRPHRRTSAALAGLIAAIGAITLGGPSAAAQLPGGGGSVDVGGTVPSFLGLSVTQPTGLGVFPAAHSYTSSFEAAVTSTEVTAQLSVTDEGQYGHLTSGSSVLALPLEVAAAGKPYASLSAPDGVLLKRWTGPIASQSTVINLLQRIAAAPAVTGPYRTVLLITAASGAP
jgi:hypothetical protein